MQIPILKSITDIRKNTKEILEQVSKKDEVIFVTKNNDSLSVILSPDYFQTILEENETFWEELQMARVKKSTKKEKVYALEDVISGKI